MADFWRGFGEGFGRSYESSFDRAVRRRELKEQREYSEKREDAKEKKKREREEALLRATLATTTKKPYNLIKETPRKVEWDEVSRRPVDQGGIPSPLFDGEDTAWERDVTEAKSVEDVLKGMKLEELTAFSKATAAGKAAHIKKEDARESAFHEYRGAGGTLLDKNLHDTGMWRELSYKRKDEDKREVEAIERDTEALNLYAANMAVLGEEDTEERGKIQGKVDGILNSYDGLIGQGLKRSYEAAMTKPLTDIKKASLVKEGERAAERAAEELDSGVLIKIIKANQSEMPSGFDKETDPVLLTSFIKERPWFKPTVLSSAEKSSKLITGLRDKWQELKDSKDSSDKEIGTAKENLDVALSLVGDHRLVMDEKGGFTATPIGSTTPPFRIYPTSLQDGGTRYLVMPRDPKDKDHIKAAEYAASQIEDNSGISAVVGPLSKNANEGGQSGEPSVHDKVQGEKNTADAEAYGKTLPPEKIGEFVKALKASIDETNMTEDQKKLIDDYKRWVEESKK